MWNNTISGEIIGRSTTHQVLVVHCYKLSQCDNKTADDRQPLSTSVPIRCANLLTTDRDVSPYRSTKTNTNFFSFASLPDGDYSIFAFEDVNKNGQFSVLGGIGWYGSDAVAGRLAHISSQNGSSVNAKIVLKKTHPFSCDSNRGKHGGVFTQLKGYNVLHLKGTRRQRGYDHGFLAAAQILDLFRFYILEELITPDYLSKGEEFLSRAMFMDDQFREEADALLQGMRNALPNLMVTELSREFNIFDLFAINAYIELPPVSRCTQFVTWGDLTHHKQIIAGRNMDGEIDIRRVTVTHLTLFAIEPEQSDQQHRIISIMWPGFLGTLTGFNEHGLYAMMNTGRCANGQPVTRAQPATPEKTETELNKFQSSGGGISMSGTIFVIARNSTEKSDPPAYVYEGDKYGGMIRCPGDVSPFLKTCIMATNHFHVYGVTSHDEQHNFGQPISLCSASRYITGRETLLALNRVGEVLTKEHIINLLRSAASGTTEHSIIWTPSDKTFWISNANPNSPAWDAPYEKWTQFNFEELFNGSFE